MANETTTSQEAAVTPTAPTQPQSTPVKKAPVVEVRKQSVQQVQSAPAIDNILAASLYRTLENYASDMVPGKKQVGDNGINNQYVLWDALKNVLSNNFQDFKAAWVVFINFVRKDPAFGVNYVFRFPDRWARRADELDAFHAVLNIAITTAEAGLNDRATVLKTVDINSRLTSFFTETMRRNLVQFYTV